MVVNIPRPDVSHPAYATKIQQYPARRAKMITSIETYPDSIDMSIGSVLLQARVCLAEDPRAAQLETWEAWVTAMQVTHTLFALTTVPEGTGVEAVIDRKPRQVTATGLRYHANTSNWLQAFFLAVTCREQDRWQGLCQIPVDLLREAGESRGTRYNPHVYHWVSALQAFMLNRSDLVEELTAALELSTPERAEFGDPDALNKLVFPQMDVFLKFIQGDSAGFNESLANGLRLFREYHTANEERVDSADGFVPLGLLAFACMAYDRSFHEPGFHLEVESEYLPKHIVERTWYGEFPT